MTRTFCRLAVTVALLPATALAVTACGSSDKTSSSGATPAASDTTPKPTTTVAVPAALKAKSTLVVAADASYPPNEFIDTDGKTVIGMDADLAQALAKVMGLKVKVKNATFDAIIPGIASKKYDLGMSSFTDSREREKVVDFVTYFSAGTSFYGKSGSGISIAGLAGLCGGKVAVEKGTTQADDAAAQSKKCTAAGKKAVSVSVFRDQNGANLAISSGRAEVGMADSPVADYIIKKSAGRFTSAGKPYGTAPYGIALRKGSPLAKPLRDALKALIADGTYKKILDKWGIASGAISSPKINGAIS
ncbi:MAG: polar amino acid transport system substrate-binding protein [Solirubrobacteraceae bacterium]|nr:polar amino acid transport system substrate-binding protein [Solirubrobacteraceae bacterium]